MNNFILIRVWTNLFILIQNRICSGATYYPDHMYVNQQSKKYYASG